MYISIIVAVGKNNEIGKDNQLLCRLSDDLKIFKKNTLEHSIIMGRKTYESIGRALPKRRNIVISRNKTFKAKGCEVFHTLEDALGATADEPEVFIIGGASLYEQTYDRADRLYMTQVEGKFDADAFFPEVDWNNWELHHAAYYPKNEKNEFQFAFKKYNRKKA